MVTNSNFVIALTCWGEKLKLALNRPTKNLKYHYQAFDIPTWERERLPIIDTAGGKLLFAAGVGMDCHHFSNGSGLRINFRWQQG